MQLSAFPCGCLEAQPSKIKANYPALSAEGQTRPCHHLAASLQHDEERCPACPAPDRPHKQRVRGAQVPGKFPPCSPLCLLDSTNSFQRLSIAGCFMVFTLLSGRFLLPLFCFSSSQPNTSPNACCWGEDKLQFGGSTADWGDATAAEHCSPSLLPASPRTCRSCSAWGALGLSWTYSARKGERLPRTGVGTAFSVAAVCKLYLLRKFIIFYKKKTRMLTHLFGNTEKETATTQAAPGAGQRELSLGQRHQPAPCARPRGFLAGFLLALVSEAHV